MTVAARLVPIAILSLLAGCAAPPPPASAPTASLRAENAASTRPVSASVAANSPTGGSAVPPAELGGIDFPVSGSEACARYFRDGMLALHSFFYDRAHASFETALT